MHLADMSTLSGFRGPDEGLEAQWNAWPRFTRFGLTHRVWPDMEAEEIKPWGAFTRGERMPDPRFPGFPGSSHLWAPPCRKVLRLHDGMIVSGEHDQGIGKSDNSGLPPVTIFRSWLGVCKRRLQPAQGHMHQAGRYHSPWRA